MLYTSEITGKTYKTVEELEKDEREFLSAEEEQEDRADEVREAFQDLCDTMARAMENIQEDYDYFMDIVKKYEGDYPDDEVGIPAHVFYDLAEQIRNLVK